MRPATSCLILIPLVLACGAPVGMRGPVPLEWRPVERAYRHYWLGDCAAALENLTTCTECAEPGTRLNAHAELLAAFCSERAGDRQNAESAYRELAATYPDSEVARTAHLRIRHLDLPRVVKGPGPDHPRPPKVKALVRVPPRYPQLAGFLGFKGWVHLRYDITEDGEVERIRVLDSEPPYLFEESAVSAARQFLYEPRAVTGAEIVLSFDGWEG